MLKSSDEFIKVAKAAVVKYFNENIGNDDGKRITIDDVSVDSYNRTLRNQEAFLYVVEYGGMYYRITYDYNRSELYLNAYKDCGSSTINITV